MIVVLALRACLKCSEWLADTLPDARCRLVVEAKGAKTHVSLTVDNVRIGTVRVLDGENRTAFAAVVGVGFVHTPSCRTLAPVLILGPWSLVLGLHHPWSFGPVGPRHARNQHRDDGPRPLHTPARVHLCVCARLHGSGFGQAASRIAARKPPTTVCSTWGDVQALRQPPATRSQVYLRRLSCITAPASLCSREAASRLAAGSPVP